MLFVLPFVTRKLSNTEGKGEKWSRSEKADATVQMHVINYNKISLSFSTHSPTHRFRLKYRGKQCLTGNPSS